ncbi:MAG: dephospho-CoA kinase [Candidatus Omnitrophica bacterium]|nr:dephospho-CoA kinase [Candidatus Omnitrophota bacterium]MDD5553017.1 dephospho-CoA kinase [Candidatus Omnitrophota bacterium]
MRKQNPSRGKGKIVIGLTGSFGSGKTTVARIFRSYGAQIIDADKIAHSVIRPGTEAYRKITGIFGQKVVKKGAGIDRKVLARIVFGNEALLTKLNSIVHPEVIKVVKKKIKASSKKIIVLDAPLLIEAGLGKITDKLVVVKAARNKQIERVHKRMGLSRVEALKRINFQVPLRDKVRLADFVIDNNGNIEKTKNQVKSIRRMLWRN